MSYNLCKIIPDSPFHLGEKGVGMEETENIIHSDTLFSAICNSYRLIYGRNELENFIESAKIDLRISSAFLEINGIKTFPLHISIKWKDYIDDFDLGKKLKKVKFVSEEIIKNFNNIKDYIASENIKNGILFSENEKTKILDAYQEKDENIKWVDIKFYEETQVPRVVLDRRTCSSNIYHFGEIKFAENCNLFFLIDYNGSKENLEKIKSAIRLLGDEGIGGDRSSGKGLFNTKFEKFSLVNNGNKFLALSLIYPKKEEIRYVEFYELILRRGFVYSIEEKNERRKSIRMFTEGSVFSNEVEGDIKDVTINNPKHRVYRFGKAFLIKIGDINEY